STLLHQRGRDAAGSIVTNLHTKTIVVKFFYTKIKNAERKKRWRQTAVKNPRRLQLKRNHASSLRSCNRHTIGERAMRGEVESGGDRPTPDEYFENRCYTFQPSDRSTRVPTGSSTKVSAKRPSRGSSGVPPLAPAANAVWAARFTSSTSMPKW